MINLCILQLRLLLCCVSITRKTNNNFHLVCTKSNINRMDCNFFVKVNFSQNRLFRKMKIFLQMNMFDSRRNNETPQV